MAIPGPMGVPALPVGSPLPVREEALLEEIGLLLEEHDSLWRRLDVAGLASLWDREEGMPIYVGDEYPSPVIGWQDLGRHFGRLGGRLREAEVASTLVAAHSVAADLAIAVVLLEWSLASVESEQRLAGQRWVSSVLRRTAAGWRFVHYAESPAYGIDPDQLAGKAGD